MKRFKKLVVMLLTCSLITASFAGMAMAAQKTGWKKMDYGWVYVQKDGTNKTGWFKDGGKWYYLDEYNDGYMVYNGPREIDGKVYVFDKNGVMLTNGWKKITNKSINGTTYTDWFYVNKNGTAKTSQWFKDGGKWYYLTDYGYMANAGSYAINGKGYLFGNDGVWISTPGWHKLKTNYSTGWYYIKSSGVCYNGWMKDGGKWYFLNYGYMVNSGAADTNQTYEEGKDHIPNMYLFNTDGSMVTKEGWVKNSYQMDGETYTTWYYAKSNGKAVTGWKKIGGKWYYFNDRWGNMVSGSAMLVGKKVYFFEESGALTSKTGWKKVTQTFPDGYKISNWYYLKKGGVCQTGWKKIDGKWYYFDPVSGVMYANGSYDIDGKSYNFNKKGALVK